MFTLPKSLNNDIDLTAEIARVVHDRVLDATRVTTVVGSLDLNGRRRLKLSSSIGEQSGSSFQVTLDPGGNLLPYLQGGTSINLGRDADGN